MGLDTTHDCWHGPYTAFTRFRTAIGMAAGIPLGIMEGHFGGPFHSTYAETETAIRREMGMNPHATFTNSLWETLLPVLPLPWSLYADDPLTPFLHHSDCDGELAVELLIPLAERLEGLAPTLREMEGSEFVRWSDAALQFAAGCRDAASKGEAVEFH